MISRRNLFGSIFGIPITIFGYGSDMENNIKNEPKESIKSNSKVINICYVHNYKSNKITTIIHHKNGKVLIFPYDEYVAEKSLLSKDNYLQFQSMFSDEFSAHYYWKVL